ncbi:hypothetical protein DFH11DRAFT_815182 [Phellopilus nigrolimitatus]|nr:hypothetical protein DFH11DRAFT_815182 [Phellopilus nigrolimitatus]
MRPLQHANVVSAAVIDGGTSCGAYFMIVLTLIYLGSASSSLSYFSLSSNSFPYFCSVQVSSPGESEGTRWIRKIGLYIKQTRAWDVLIARRRGARWCRRRASRCTHCRRRAHRPSPPRSSVSLQRPSLRPLSPPRHVPCDACRRIRVKCARELNGGPCQLCSKKGILCTTEPEKPRFMDHWKGRSVSGQIGIGTEGRTKAGVSAGPSAGPSAVDDEGEGEHTTSRLRGDSENQPLASVIKSETGSHVGPSEYRYAVPSNLPKTLTENEASLDSVSLGRAFEDILCTYSPAESPCSPSFDQLGVALSNMSAWHFGSDSLPTAQQNQDGCGIVPTASHSEPKDLIVYARVDTDKDFLTQFGEKSDGLYEFSISGTSDCVNNALEEIKLLERYREMFKSTLFHPEPEHDIDDMDVDSPTSTDEYSDESESDV